jgi:antirestriction protein
MNHEHEPPQQATEPEELHTPGQANHEPDSESARDEPPLDGQPETEDHTLGKPQIWVGSWLDYNNGVLHGHWIDAARETAEVWADVAAMLAASPTARKYGEVAEDWGIFDHENFGPLRIGESETISYVTAVARGVSEHGPAFAAWAHLSDRDAASLERFEEAYLGEYESVEAYAEQMIDELGYDDLLDQALTGGIRSYMRIDTAALARDMQYSGELQACRSEDGRVWLFDGRR